MPIDPDAPTSNRIADEGVLGKDVVEWVDSTVDGCTQY